MNHSHRPAPAGRSWLARQIKRRPKPVWMVALLHLAALGIALCVFSLPHHVLPRSRDSLGIVSSRDSVPVVNTAVQPAATAEAQSASAQAPDAAPAQPVSNTRVGDFSEKFADKFVQGEPQYPENGYISENLNISISEYYQNGIRFYVADFYIRDISCLRSAFAKGEYGRNITEDIHKVAVREQGVLVMNGDFYGIREGGVCVRNGTLYYSDDVVREIGVLYWDGSFDTFAPAEFNCDAEIAKGAYQIWNFGPAMLDENGNPRAEFDEVYHGIYGNQPRSALGYFEPGHYCFIVADGRTDDSRGLTLEQLGGVAQTLGCKQCYNMDGGRTSQMTFGTQVVNNPVTGGRNCSDYLLLVDKVQ